MFTEDQGQCVERIGCGVEDGIGQLVAAEPAELGGFDIRPHGAAHELGGAAADRRQGALGSLLPQIDDGLSPAVQQIGQAPLIAAGAAGALVGNCRLPCRDGELLLAGREVGGEGRAVHDRAVADQVEVDLDAVVGFPGHGVLEGRHGLPPLGARVDALEGDCADVVLAHEAAHQLQDGVLGSADDVIVGDPHLRHDAGVSSMFLLEGVAGVGEGLHRGEGGGLLGLGLHLVERREQHRHEQHDDRNDHEQLGERERRTRPAAWAAKASDGEGVCGGHERDPCECRAAGAGVSSLTGGAPHRGEGGDSRHAHPL
jgi:hypothetical protein